MKTIVEKTFEPTSELQRSLVAEAESDPLNNDQEQTWPTQEELEKAQAEQNQIKKRVPKGTSEYQAAWIVSDEEDDNNEQNVYCSSSPFLSICFSSFRMILKMMMIIHRIK